MLLPRGMAGRGEVRSSQPELKDPEAGGAGKGNPSRDPLGGSVDAQGRGCVRTDTLGEQLKKLEPPLQPFEGGEEISSCSVPHNFSS